MEDSQVDVAMPDVTSDVITDLFRMDVEVAADLSSVTIRDPFPSVGSTSVIGVSTGRFMEQVTAAVDSLMMGGSMGSESCAVGWIVCEEETKEEMVDYE